MGGKVFEMLRLNCLLGLILVAAISNFGQKSVKTDKRLEELRNLGFEAINQQDWTRAIESFQSLIRLAPNDGIANYGIAVAKFNLNDITAAKEDVMVAIRKLEKARNLKRAADALVLRAIIAAREDNLKDAITNLKRALEYEPRNFDANLSMARALYGNGDIKGSLMFFERAITLQPQNINTRFFYASALESLGELKLAQSQYRKILEINPNNSKGNLGLGVLLVKSDVSFLDEGIALLRRAIETNPNSYEAHVELGKALLKNGRTEQAIDHLIAAADLKTENPEPHFQLSIAYRKLGRIEDSKRESEVVKEIHRRHRGNPENLNK